MRSMIRKYVETEDIHPDYVVMAETDHGMVLASVNPLDKDKDHAIATAKKLLGQHLGVGSIIKREVLFKVKESESGLPVWEEVKEKSCGIDYANGKSWSASYVRDNGPSRVSCEKTADKPQKPEDKPKPLTIWDAVSAIKEKFGIVPIISSSYGNGMSKSEYKKFSISKKHGCLYQVFVYGHECPFNMPSVDGILNIIDTLNLAGE